MEKWDLAATDLAHARKLEPPSKRGASWWQENPSPTVTLISENSRLFERVVKLRPDDEPLFVARTRYLGGRSRWQEAAQTAALALRLKPDSNSQATYLRLLAFVNDRDGYRRLRQEMLGRSLDREDWLSTYNASQAALLVPDPEVDLQAALKLAQRSLDLGRQRPDGASHEAPRQLQVALAHLRLKQPDEADAALETALDASQSDSMTIRRATCLVIRAMIRELQKQPGDARRLLADAEQIVRTRLSTRPAGELGDDWREWLRFDILRQEAAARFAPADE
jgi:tetratricopeptide (TPR) repeat protein